MPIVAPFTTELLKMYLGKSLLYQVVPVEPGNIRTFMAAPAALTTRETLVLCDKVPLVPVSVSV